MTYMINVTNSGTLAAGHQPDECPRCHYKVEPMQMGGWLIGDAAQATSILQVVFRCTRRGCNELFIANFTNPLVSTQQPREWELTSTTPVNPQPPSIAPEVAALSPFFVEVFTQASAAESYGLSQVCGVGYRKALEFLVKDFCIAKEPNAKEEILKKLLGAVISEHIKDENIKECARRATWLGNDETHYVRRWEEKDIRDLKSLLDLTVNWIRVNEQTAQYLRDMPEGK